MPEHLSSEPNAIELEIGTYRCAFVIEISQPGPSRKGALDDGNAYGRAIQATAGRRLSQPRVTVKHALGTPDAGLRPFADTLDNDTDKTAYLTVIQRCSRQGIQHRLAIDAKQDQRHVVSILVPANQALPLA